MPASMISAPTGGSPNVIGSSMAMVATDPVPGRTPISVPTSAPIRQNRRLYGVAATWKPSARLPRRSCMIDSLPSEARPELERQGKQLNEQQHTERRHQDAGDGGLDPAGFRRRQPGDHERHEGGKDQSERAHRIGKNDNRYRDPERSAYRVTLERLAVGEKAHGGDGHAEGEKNAGEDAR